MQICFCCLLTSHQCITYWLIRGSQLLVPGRPWRAKGWSKTHAQRSNKHHIPCFFVFWNWPRGRHEWLVGWIWLWASIWEPLSYIHCHSNNYCCYFSCAQILTLKMRHSKNFSLDCLILIKGDIFARRYFCDIIVFEKMQKNLVLAVFTLIICGSIAKGYFHMFILLCFHIHSWNWRIYEPR